jgi:acyl carrier protein
LDTLLLAPSAPSSSYDTFAGYEIGDFVEVLRLRAKLTPEKVAFRFLTSTLEVDEVVTFVELHHRARQMAALINQVAEPGDRALIICQPGIDYIVAFFGCLYAEIIAVPAYPPTKNRPIDRLVTIVEDAQPSLAIATRDVLAVFGTRMLDKTFHDLKWLSTDDAKSCAAVEVLNSANRKNKIAFLQYTSGSTSSPKGVQLTHQNLLLNSEMILNRFRTTHNDHIFSWLPPFHDMGLIGGILQPIYVGATCTAMLPSAFLERPLSWLEAISKFQCTVSGAPNFAYNLCVERADSQFGRASSSQPLPSMDLKSWRCAFIGAEPVRAETLHSFVSTFSPYGFSGQAFLPCYGLAEATLLVSGNDAYTNWVETPIDLNGKSHHLVGHGLASQSKILIVEPDTAIESQAGFEGEIWVPANAAASGYWRKPIQTELTFQAYTSDDRRGPYLRTGDLGLIDNGVLYITGRIKDLVIVRGKNHYPQDIEYTAQGAHSDLQIGGVAAFTIEQDRHDSLVIVCELRRHALRHFDKDSIIKAIKKAVSIEHGLSVAEIYFLPPARLPRTSSGKVQRHACRAAILNGSLKFVDHKIGGLTSVDVEPTNVNLAQQIADVIATLLKIEPRQVSLDSPISELGVDSLDAVNITFEIESRFKIKIPVESFFDQSSIRKLADDLFENPQLTKGDETPNSKQDSAAIERGPLFSLMYFSSQAQTEDLDCYRLVSDGVLYADANDFHAVWLPERHFHEFGGLYPSPAVLASAVASQTKNVRIRAGSVVLPLSNPIRVAEEWSVIDNLSRGRVDLALAAGWNPNDFALAPENYATRNDLLFQGMQTVKSLWRGDSVTKINGLGKPISIRIFPRPIQKELNIWITCSGGVERFVQAGAAGANVLTALLFQTPAELAEKLTAYRKARSENGFDPDAGCVTLMLHTFLDQDSARCKDIVRKPFIEYLESSVDLWRHGEVRLGELNEVERQGVLEFAFERYYRTSALFGSPHECIDRVRTLQACGVNEIACLLDFGVPRDQVMSSLQQVRHLMDLCSSGGVKPLKVEIDSHGSSSKLDSSITYVEQLLEAANQRPKNIFLTGATGFLGTHLLAAYLDDEHTNVYCLVRAENAKKGVKRIEICLKERKLWRASMLGRIIPVVGDLIQSNLGLCADDFAKLGSSVDAIVHAACKMSLIATYEQLAATNVTGTQTLLSLAARGRPKIFHYVSTVGVFQGGYSAIESVDESCKPRGTQRWPAAMARSKWEAEQLVWQAAERGLSVKVYRPGTLMGHSKSGVLPTSSYLQSFIEACIESGCVPDSEETLQICPVDFVAHAIVQLSGNALSSGQAFHIINPDPLPMRSLAPLLNQSGFELIIKPVAQWRKGLDQMCSQRAFRAFRSVSNLVNQLGADQSLILKSAVAPQVTSQMYHLLAQLGVSCPTCDVQLLEKYSRHLNPHPQSASPHWQRAGSQFVRNSLDHQPMGQ